MVETATVTKSLSSNCRLREGTSTVEVMDPCGVAGWDAAVSSFEASTVFHTAGWASVLSETHNYEPAYFVERDSSTIGAILPILSVNSALTGRRGVSLPFSDSCPFLSRDSLLRERLFHTAIEYGRKRHWRYLECRCGEPPTAQATPSISFLEHVVELADEDMSARRLRSEVRTAIRKAESSGVRVVVERNLNAVRQYYGLHCRTRRKHGLPPQPFSFFASISKHLVQNNLGSVFIAFSGETPVAGALFLHFGDHVVYKFGASDPRHQQLRGNNLLFWEAMRFFYGNGYRVLSLGRSSAKDFGLRRFKRGWGADERALVYYRFDLRTSSFVGSGDDLASGWYNSVFSHLPLRLSRLIGVLLYRHLG